jgi:hypothetical protein
MTDNALAETLLELIPLVAGYVHKTAETFIIRRFLLSLQLIAGFCDL